MRFIFAPLILTSMMNCFELMVSNNCFSRFIVYHIIKVFFDHEFDNRPRTSDSNTTCLIFCLPYLDRHSLQLKAKRSRLVEICSAFRSSVVYQFKCLGCYALYYVKATRNFLIRFRTYYLRFRTGFLACFRLFVSRAMTLHKSSFI